VQPHSREFPAFLASNRKAATRFVEGKGRVLFSMNSHEELTTADYPVINARLLCAEKAGNAPENDCELRGEEGYRKEIEEGTLCFGYVAGVPGPICRPWVLCHARNAMSMQITFVVTRAKLRITCHRNNFRPPPSLSPLLPPWLAPRHQDHPPWAVDEYWELRKISDMNNQQVSRQLLTRFLPAGHLLILQIAVE